MKEPKKEVTTEEIWRKLSDRLRQFIRSRVGAESETDDILQAVFLRIHQKLNDLHQVDRLESWVFQIARNAIVDYFRRRNKENVQIDDVILPSTTTSKQLDNLNTVVADCLSALIEYLPEDQKRAVAMYELEGKSQKDIAAQESISLSGAKSRIQRGRKRLEVMLRECCQLEIDSRGNILECELTEASGSIPPANGNARWSVACRRE